MIENTKDIDELEFINSFSHSGKPVKDLSRIKALLSDLGDPQDSLKFVHIAGTNGKGSMAQMFSEVFQCAGMKTGLGGLLDSTKVIKTPVLTVIV